MRMWRVPPWSEDSNQRYKFPLEIEVIAIAAAAEVLINIHTKSFVIQHHCCQGILKTQYFRQSYSGCWCKYRFNLSVVTIFSYPFLLRFSWLVVIILVKIDLGNSSKCYVLLHCCYFYFYNSFFFSGPYFHHAIPGS